ncbi:hypothetical protein GCM10027447_35630 [Glycomyces halotolerans]
MDESTPLWETTDLPVLRAACQALDRSGRAVGIDAVHPLVPSVPREEVPAALARLASTGYIEDERGFNGSIAWIKSITEKGRQLVSGYPAARIEASVPQLDDLGEQLGDVLAQVLIALQVQPNHPEASKWRRFLTAAIDVGVDFGSKFSAEIAKAHLGLPPPN